MDLTNPPKRQNTIAESEFMSLTIIICKPAINSSHFRHFGTTIKSTSFPEEKNPTSNQFIHQKHKKKNISSTISFSSKNVPSCHLDKTVEKRSD